MIFLKILEKNQKNKLKKVDIQGIFSLQPLLFKNQKNSMNLMIIKN